MTHVMFNLVMWHAGHVFWLDTFETYEECRVVQLRLEEEQPDDKFACPFIVVEDT